MKFLLCLLLTACAVAVFAQRNSFALEPMDWSTTTILTTQISFPTTTKKDLLVYFDISSGGSPVVAIRRRNNEGAYVNVANITAPTSPNLVTNGKWIAMQSELGFVMFSIDANNQLSPNASLIPSVANGFLLSDDTFVGYYSTAVSVAPYVLKTFKYDATSTNWNEVAVAALELPAPPRYQNDVSSYRVYDNHLVLIDYPANVSIRIYERQADLSWDLVETVPVNNTRGDIGNIHYNGVDTLIYSVLSQASTSPGIVFIYTKINGQWAEQTFTVESVGYRPFGYLGLSVAFTDANNVLISAGLEGITVGSGFTGGKILFVTRASNGQWQPFLDLTGENLFGLSVAVNDYDIIVPSLIYAGYSGAPLTFYSAPSCFTEPMDVTCNNQQVNDCSDVSIEELYTINNPQCGAVSVSVNGFSLVNNQEVSAQLTFTRGYGADFSCNATVTCPAPPVAGNNNISTADALRFGLMPILVYVAVMLL